MASYNITYRMPFFDMLGIEWRVDFLLKDGAITTDPLILLGADSPLKLDKQNRNEDQFAPIIHTVATISYVYRGGSDPLPEVFINIENDVFLIEVYKNNVLEWKGFLSGDENSFPWVPAPFTFSLTATDFTFMDSALINLNQTDLFLYDYITIGDFFNRTLFFATGYDDISLKILYNKKPDVIGAGKITDSLFIHTDAFYDFIKGRDFVTTCLERLLKSIGARLFYASGSYWMQFLQDIGTSPQSIITITPTDLSGTIEFNLDTNIIMGNDVNAELIYSKRSQNVLIPKALKQQSINYNIKTINQIGNFDWHSFTVDHPDAPWIIGDGMTFERHGTGSVDDPYRLRTSNEAVGTFRSLQQPITISSGQRLSIQFKVVGNYVDNIAIGFRIGENATAQYDLTASGSWGPTSTGSVSNIVFPLTISNTNNGTFEVITDPVPPGAHSDLHVRIAEITPVSSVPGGQTPYVDIYPVFVGIFGNEYVSYTEKVVNPKKYSFVDDDDEFFFMDIQQANISNTIYYDNSGTKTPLPAKNWDGKNIDEISVKLRADQRARQGFGVLGNFISNSLSFQQMVSLSDKDMLSCLLIRDAYQVRPCIHDIMVVEIMEENAANATYTITPVKRQQN